LLHKVDFINKISIIAKPLHILLRNFLALRKLVLEKGFAAIRLVSRFSERLFSKISRDNGGEKPVPLQINLQSQLL